MPSTTATAAAWAVIAAKAAKVMRMDFMDVCLFPFDLLLFDGGRLAADCFGCFTEIAQLCFNCFDA
jgi:hypothetical protein